MQLDIDGAVMPGVIAARALRTLGSGLHAGLRADTNVVAERRTRLTMDGRRCVALSLGALLLVAPGVSIPD